MRCELLHLKDVYPFLGEDGCDPTLEIYLPHNYEVRENQKRPCILLCPGGGYRIVSPREAEPIALHLFPEGFNVFVLTYSTTPHCFPTQIREVAAAMDMIHKHGEEWNCNLERVAIMGFSAGAHLSAHYSNRYDCPEVREVFPDSKPVKASILCYPVITAQPAFRHNGSIEKLSGHIPVTEEDVEKFSCEKMVSDATPPAFIWHTAADPIVPVNNSLLYAQALSAHKIPFELHIYPFGKHGLATADLWTNTEIPPEVACTADWIPNLKQWLKINL